MTATNTNDANLGDLIRNQLMADLWGQVYSYLFPPPVDQIALAADMDDGAIDGQIPEAYRDQLQQLGTLVLLQQPPAPQPLPGGGLPGDDGGVWLPDGSWFPTDMGLPGDGFPIDGGWGLPGGGMGNGLPGNIPILAPIYLGPGGGLLNPGALQGLPTGMSPNFITPNLLSSAAMMQNAMLPGLMLNSMLGNPMLGNMGGGLPGMNGVSPMPVPFPIPVPCMPNGSIPQYSPPQCSPLPCGTGSGNPVVGIPGPFPPFGGGMSCPPSPGVLPMPRANNLVWNNNNDEDNDFQLIPHNTGSNGIRPPRPFGLVPPPPAPGGGLPNVPPLNNRLGSLPMTRTFG
ncbi:MAG: hypothetical protein SFZ03_09740 [Candidatus Melainabacteria bacterium]|nr:hypothetical protein [Candidatus Melainabacteria bacterium]